ncbi:uridine diphosphate glucose pyrophosphatase NUDT22-like [Apostichopus japonicus]|uniref:uridine diphosphate glucose pyrophosphatase NUDT22-like n=1 Tax=Stichopus japonicus TaxID=307972 RepID=UPI003AB22328
MAETEVSVIFIAPQFPGICQSDLKVLISSSYNRENLSLDRQLQVDQIWKQRVQQNPHLFDASKFRYHSMQVQNGCTHLRLGITSYKDFLGTNWAPDAKELAEIGKDQCGNTQAFMSDALGVGNFTETSDGYVVFIRRSQRVGEAQGLLDFPGGHPEPAEIPGGSSQADLINIPSLSPNDVLVEFYESTLREIRDEINIPLNLLSEPRLMGVAANHVSSKRPSAEFYVRCALGKRDVLHLYNQGGAEADESSNIIFVPVEDIRNIEESMMWKEMAPSAKGCMKLFNELKKDTKS